MGAFEFVLFFVPDTEKKAQQSYRIIMCKCLPFLKGGRRSIFRSRNDVQGKSVSPEEEVRVKNPQSTVPRPPVIFTFENGDALNGKKQTMHSGGEEREQDNGCVKLLLPIVVVLC